MDLRTAVRDLRVNTSAPELSGPAATGGDIEPDLASLLEHLAQLAGAAAAPLLPALEEQALGGKLRNQLRVCPALATCTTIDWYDEWPLDALQAVARAKLQDVAGLSDPATMGHVVAACVHHHVFTRELASRYEEEFRRVVHVTSTHFLDLLELLEQQSAKGGREEREAPHARRARLGEESEQRPLVDVLAARRRRLARRDRAHELRVDEALDARVVELVELRVPPAPLAPPPFTREHFWRQTQSSSATSTCFWTSLWCGGSLRFTL